MHIAVFLSLYLRTSAVNIMPHEQYTKPHSGFGSLAFWVGLPRRSSTACTLVKKPFRDNTCMFALMDFAKIAENAHSKTDLTAYALYDFYDTAFYQCVFLPRTLPCFVCMPLAYKKSAISSNRLSPRAYSSNACGQSEQFCGLLLRSLSAYRCSSRSVRLQAFRPSRTFCRKPRLVLTTDYLHIV
jgi:hypothetical protein